MITQTTNNTTRKQAALISFAVALVLMFGGHDVSRTYTTRQTNARYAAEYVIGESTRNTDVLNGTGYSNQTRVAKQELPGADEAEAQSLIQGFVAQPTADLNSTSNCGMFEARK